MSSPAQPAPQTVSPRAPAGYTLLRGPDDRTYQIPNFLLSVAEHENAVRCSKEEICATDAARGPLPITEPPYYTMAEDTVVLPPDPALSEHELLTIHAEIRVLQSRYSLSYKDAAHRVYLQEVARLEAKDNALRAFAALQNRLRYPHGRAPL
ncbi:hypothetical protein NLJ89_g8303 [Agrocybe chaxingu]|uniref:Uncharacterized protein n=1 Tax=Agrocybe chaxingu TaxID=84603 RepID=A0A9W8MSV9_9AGAR|nr:hypothetical protein NLJ89_g8303 [Agrocybe chaxingu]